MIVQELLIQISSIASIEGEEVAKAEIKINGNADNDTRLALDLFYDKEQNIIFINTVEE